VDEEPIEILAGMAERGEVDPWNIDIVEVTDRFLNELERRRQLDLRISGRTLFYAAILLRLKSVHMGEPDCDALPEDGEEFGDSEFDAEPGFDYARFSPVERLEREIQRRIGRKEQRSRPVTLFELIKALKTAEKEERRRQRMRTVREDTDDLVSVDDVIATAHNEDYRTASDKVQAGVGEVVHHDGKITLRELADQLGWHLTDVYIPLLFLNLDGRVAIWQDEFFGDLYIGELLGGE
jgi:segregation and condensation protein A